MYQIDQLIATIKRIKNSGNFQKYLDKIQFPFYRNLEINSAINFEFPLTVFIGQNGCGKSSCLHALYGAPKGNTPYEFWFDTSVDPIEYFDDQKKRHSFWYKFKDDADVIREVVKARIRRNNDPNYWETSRPLVWAGMTARDDGGRDSPIEKNVVYIDFRAELSAFDKFFHFGNNTRTSTRNKQEFIRKKSKQLQKILSGEKATISTKAGPINKPLRNLSQNELEWISFILGKQYVSAQYIEHSFFRNFGYTVVFNTGDAKYSEAFAGSGEIAVVKLVLNILNAPEFSLILLDEPEVSLHPGAQERLKYFLLDQIKNKKHQVIVTSHSANLVSGLPKEAIKVFYQNLKTKRFLIKENLTAEEAFYHIEFPLISKKEIIVEDILAQEIISATLLDLGMQARNLFNIKFNPGGESVIKKEFIPVYCRENNSKKFIFFDGDQKPTFEHYDWTSFPELDISVNFLKEKIRQQTGEAIRFSVDSLGNTGHTQQHIELLKHYLEYYRTNVFYLPRSIPEEIIWDEELAIISAQSILEQAVFEEFKNELSAVSGFKEKFSLYSKFIFGNNSSDDIFNSQKIFITKWIHRKNADYNFLHQKLKKLLEI